MAESEETTNGTCPRPRDARRGSMLVEVSGERGGEGEREREREGERMSLLKCRDM